MTTKPDSSDAPQEPADRAAQAEADESAEALAARVARAAADIATRRPSHDGRIGKVLCGRYRIDSVIGAGGFGVVFRATSLAVMQPVALKLMLGEHVSNASQVARFEREALSVSSLRAPNTIRVFDFGRDEDGNLFIVMELLAGRPLSAVLGDTGPLPPQRAVHIAIQIAKSLAEAHEAGIVHRDLKPDNVFLADLPGEEDYVKVLDFGIAKLVGGTNPAAQNELTRQGAVIGTPTYMSPEQARGATIDARSDLYSLGVVLFRMLTGQAPFVATSLLALAWKHNEEEPPDVCTLGLPDDPIAPALGQLVAHLLAKDPRERPASARAVIAALQAVAYGPSSTATRVMPAAATVPKRVDPEAPTVQLPPDAPTPTPPTPPPPTDPLAARGAIDPTLLERATKRLAQSLGPIAKVVAKKAAQRAKNDGELVRLMAEQLEPHEREPFLTALGFLPRS